MPLATITTPPKLQVNSPTEEVVAKVNQLGLTKAAKKFKTSPSSLSRWLRSQGYFAKHQYVKVAAPTQGVPINNN